MTSSAIVWLILKLRLADRLAVDVARRRHGQLAASRSGAAASSLRGAPRGPLVSLPSMRGP
jgi:hypothetical protein